MMDLDEIKVSVGGVQSSNIMQGIHPSLLLKQAVWLIAKVERQRKLNAHTSLAFENELKQRRDLQREVKKLKAELEHINKLDASVLRNQEIRDCRGL